MCWFSGMLPIFCNNFARWLQKMVATCDVMCWFSGMLPICDVMCWFSGMLPIFCNNFARWLQKIVATRARNPRFYFVHAGTKPRFLTKKWHQKSGIPCSGSNCDVMCWFSGMLLSFVTTLQDDYKINMWCDVLVFWDATIFCNNLARWLQNMVATCDMMCWFFWDAMIFCNNFMLPKRRFWMAEGNFWGLVATVVAVLSTLWESVGVTWPKASAGEKTKANCFSFRSLMAF